VQFCEHFSFKLLATTDHTKNSLTRLASKMDNFSLRFLIVSTIAFLLLRFEVPYFYLQVENGRNSVVCHRSFLKDLR